MSDMSICQFVLLLYSLQSLGFLLSKVFWLALLWVSIIAGVEMILTGRLWGCCGWFKVGSCWMNAKELIKG